MFSKGHSGPSTIHYASSRNRMLACISGLHRRIVLVPALVTAPRQRSARSSQIRVPTHRSHSLHRIIACRRIPHGLSSPALILCPLPSNSSQQLEVIQLIPVLHNIPLNLASHTPRHKVLRRPRHEIRRVRNRLGTDPHVSLLDHLGRRLHRLRHP